MEGLESFFTATEQLKLFGLSCLFGIPLGIIYDIFRVIRIMTPHNKVLVAIEDLIYFALYGVFLMCFTAAAARSEYRLYYSIGNLLGFILYYFTVGSIVTKFFNMVINVLKKWFGIIFAPIRKKIALICEKLRPFFVGSLQNLHLSKKNSKNHLIDKPSLLYNKNIKRNKRKNVKKFEKKTNSRRCKTKADV